MLDSLSVLNEIQRQPGISAENLAQQLGSSARSIYRCVQHLREQGYAINRKMGPTGGFRLAKTAPWMPELTITEVQALLLAGQAMLEQPWCPEPVELKQALDKITSTLQRKDVQALQKLLAAVEFQGTAGGTHGMPYVHQLQDAVLKNQKVRIRYHKPEQKEETERVIHPYLLRLRNGLYYVDGYCELGQCVKTFCLERITELVPCGEWFQSDPAFATERAACFPWGVICDTPEQFTFRVMPSTACWVAERIWHVNQKIEWQPDGSLLFKTFASGRPEIRQWVLHWGSGIEVLEPVGFREEVQQEAQRMTDLNRTT